MPRHRSDPSTPKREDHPDPFAETALDTDECSDMPDRLANHIRSTLQSATDKKHDH